MALGDPYVELATLKDYLAIPETKIEMDDVLQDTILSSSAEIERHCNRQFNAATSVSARKFAPNRYGTIVRVDDFYTDEGLVVEYDASGSGDWVEIAEGDYDLFPFNGVVDGQPGWPYYEIRLANCRVPVRGSRQAIRPSVRVTAKWGWTDVPAPVHQACLIMAAETFQMKDAPFGVAGSDQFGNVLRVRDNRIAAGKLARYVRNRIPVG